MLLTKNAFTLFIACDKEGRRAKRWWGESTKRTLTPMHGGELTHPECASLFDPLSGKPERGEKSAIFFYLMTMPRRGYPFVETKPIKNSAPLGATHGPV